MTRTIRTLAVLALLVLPACAGPSAGDGTLIAFAAVAPQPRGSANFDELGDGVDPSFGAPLARYPAIEATLRRPVPAGVRTFVFVLVGCEETTAVLHVGPDRISADATGAEEAAGADDVTCVAPQFYFAAFDIRADLVPPGAVLGW